MNTIIKDYPTLYKSDKSDKVRTWKIQASLHPDNTCWIENHYGQKGGKITFSEKQVKEGKNIGKKNETSVQQQIILICDKTFKDKKEKEEYLEIEPSISSSESKSPPLKFSFAPMLADRWNPEPTTKRKIDIIFPCMVQPKLDGIRCLIYLNKDGIIVNQSRQLKYFKNLDHINNELIPVFKKFPDIVLDGELYNHDIVFNQISGIVKKEKLKDEDKQKITLIQYHIYDTFIKTNNNLSFIDRMDIIQIISKIHPYKFLKFVETYPCESKDDIIKHYHPLFIINKYEGVILRNKEGIYEFRRTKNLQKFKTFEDDEFEIIGFKQGEGHDDGTVIWKCKTPNGKEFDVRPVGTVKERSELFNNGASYVGKMLTVTYQELSEFGVPRFPVGKTIREEYE